MRASSILGRVKFSCRAAMTEVWSRMARAALSSWSLGGEHQQSLVCAYPVEPTSAVGSGDIFGGVVAARLAIGDDLVAAARQAAAATSIVLASGDTFAPPDLQRLTERLLAERDGEFDWRWPLHP
jgi:sugar/nucleoside kinase (ribokinase family)